MNKFKFSLLLAGGAVVSPGTAGAAVAMEFAIENVAFLKDTFGDTAFGAPTSRGVDGIDGYADSGNWTHADYPTSATPYPGEGTNAPNPYWEVDLAGSYNLDSFEVVDRIGCCPDNRLGGATVTLLGAGGSILGTQGLLGGGGTESFNNGGLGWSGVERVRIDGVSQYFQFSEFRAFTLSSVATPINWAAGAPAQFYDSVGTPVGSWSSLPAANITDGNPNSLSHPDNPTPHIGYYVDIDLGQEIFIDNLDLTGRLDGCCPERLEGYTIEFLDAAGGLVHSMLHAGQTTTTENIDVIGDYGGNGPLARTVRIVNTSGNDYGPQVGELAVFGTSIPEPSGVLLSLFGAGFLLRRRR